MGGKHDRGMMDTVASRRPFKARRLGRELLGLRKKREMSAAEVAKTAQPRVAESSVTRIEAATMAANSARVRSLLDVYDVRGEQRDVLLKLAREANSEAWWHAFTGRGALPKWFEVYVDLEAESDELNLFDPQYVNGLAQTEDYARALISAGRQGDGDVAATIDRRVELRMERQRKVIDQQVTVNMILDESALRRVYGGPAVMVAQCEKLLEVADYARCTLQVLPLDAPPAVVGGFHVLEFPEPDDPPVVYSENEHGAIYLESADEVREYRRTFGRLQAAAHSPEASKATIRSMIKEYH